MKRPPPTPKSRSRHSSPGQIWLRLHPPVLGEASGSTKEAVPTLQPVAAVPPGAAPANITDAIVASTLNCDPARLPSDTTLRRLGADDLDAAEIIYFCEQVLELPEGRLWMQVDRRPVALSLHDLRNLVDVSYNMPQKLS
jgi:hypothetical protein